jgi:nucleotidyltransferase substrate binding protein (TIGR01987 family)
MIILNDKIVITPLLNAQHQLNEAIQVAHTPLEITGTIKCFEYCYELSWKTMRKILEQMGIVDINNPRSVFTASYKNHLIQNLELWYSFIETCNLTVHTYDENLAQTVFESLPQFSTALNQFVQKIKTL